MAAFFVFSRAYYFFRAGLWKSLIPKSQIVGLTLGCGANVFPMVTEMHSFPLAGLSTYSVDNLVGKLSI